MTCHLSGKAYERYAVIVGCGKTCHQIGSAGTAGHQTDPNLSCGSGIGVCFVNQSLLMPGKYDVQIVLFVKLVADVNGTRPGIAE